jgi:hypothetical protein
LRLTAAEPCVLMSSRKAGPIAVVSSRLPSVMMYVGAVHVL